MSMFWIRQWILFPAGLTFICAAIASMITAGVLWVGYGIKKYDSLLQALFAIFMFGYAVCIVAGVISMYFSYRH